jgi:FkbM family methyltransferase
MKYLIDCGTHFFEGLKQLNNIYQFDDTWTIYSFEPNPITFNESHKYKPNYFNLIHINAAVSTKDGYKIINCEHNENFCGEGSNILEFPPQTDTLYGHTFQYHKLQTKTYDLCSFIINLPDIDFLVIKMDIEGEEYSILPRLLNSSIKINDIYIEFHERFFEDTKHYSNLNASFISQLHNNNTNVIVWD